MARCPRQVRQLDMIPHQRKRAPGAPVRGALALILAAVLVQNAAGFTDIDHGALTLATTAAATYDSDIQGGPQADSDFIYSLYPDLLYKEDQSQLNVDAGAGVTFQRYQKYTQYNSNDPDAHLNMGIAPDQGLPVSGLFDTSYAQTDDVDYDLNTRVIAKTLSSNMNGLYAVGRQLSFGINGTYMRVDRGTFGTQLIDGEGASMNYSDFLNVVNVALQYNHLEANATSVEGGPVLDQSSNSYSVMLSRPIYDEIKASATYGYRFLDRSPDETDTEEPNANGSFYSVSLDGPFLPPNAFPKLKSLLSVSYEQATTPGINDEGSNRLIALARLNWSATDTTTLGLTADHTQVLASNNLTVVSTDALADIGQDFGHFIHADVGGGYSRRDYVGINRTDNIGQGYARVHYKATKSFTVGIDYQIHATYSNIELASYTRNVARLFATYTF
jgi:Putative beta-barrel porin 2